ncbi:hypothetical protein [Natranaerobius trueperi]|uniref:Uncharacterized protein n=1 Tax=Natranaerobius trueperi TaxID=759412 RepID=A0A226BZK6_9FIRM|nr:hypothetical protein [Natranaerobius trueperi]OWZ84375.1 hypothetical protein CDO51_03690 [Natranaerobius trueperi]
MIYIKKINDRVLAGIIAGLGANILKNAIEQFAFKSRYSKNTGIMKAVGFFMPKRKIKTQLGKLNGFLADNAVAAFLGVCTSYLFTFTGKDYSLVKGIAMGDLTWSFAYGVLARLGASSIKEQDPKTSFTLMISHAAFGLTSAILLTKLVNPNLYKPHFKSLGSPKRSDSN